MRKFGALQFNRIRMIQGNKYETVFKLPIENILVIGRISTNVFPSPFYCSILIRCIVFFASAKLPEREGSISPSIFLRQLLDYYSKVLALPIW